MTTSSPLVDQHGRVMFHCAICRQPLTSDDFFDLALRPPDRGESASDYCDAELIDQLEHLACLQAAKAG